MISYNVDKEKELLDLFARRWKAKRLLLRSEEWKVVLEWMKEFFQTDLPCFQKQDGERLFDPLDAMAGCSPGGGVVAGDAAEG